jgi:hypothetical protein
MLSEAEATTTLQYSVLTVGILQLHPYCAQRRMDFANMTLLDYVTWASFPSR